MSTLDRRRFLQAGGLAGFAGVAGCAGLAAQIDAIDPSELASLDMDGFLRGLDATLGFLRSSSTLDSVVPEPVRREAERDPRWRDSDSLVRDAIRTLFLTSSFGELSEAGQAHPGMQARMWTAMDEVERGVSGMHAVTKALTPTERADIARALRRDPALGQRVLEALDREAVRAGVSESRRAHLLKVGRHVVFRLRQSGDLFFDELDAKMQKVSGRVWTADESEQRLRAMMGEPAFEERRARMLAYAFAWQQVAGAGDGLPPPASAPAPAPSPSPAGAGAPTVWIPAVPGSLLLPPSEGTSGGVIAPSGRQVWPAHPRGKWTVRAGWMLLGLGVVHGLQGLTLVFAGGLAPALFEFTHGGLQILGGLVTLIVGAVQSAGPKETGAP